MGVNYFTEDQIKQLRINPDVKMLGNKNYISIN